MARQHEDERFRSALQRLSNHTGVTLREGDDWETRKKLANDGRDSTYQARVTKILMDNEHGEEEELFRGSKADVTAQIEVMNRLIECSEHRGKPKIPIGLSELPSPDEINSEFRKVEPLKEKDFRV